jgi:hemolysin III
MSEKDNKIQYSQKEELANVLTHGIGIILSLIGIILLILKALKYGDHWHLLGFIVFGISLLIMFSSSTMYHYVHGGNTRKKDYVCCYMDFWNCRYCS